jgi:Na+/melibiose symporter-like transporter
MDSGVVPNVVPLQMKKYGASGFEIGLLTGTVMEILATAMVAVISTWSDRHRGRLGRRMPFILWSTPPLAIFLALLGFSPELAGWVKGHVPGGMGSVSHASLTLAMMSVLMVGYKFFDNFPQSVYYYLWPDVIPARVMGTFACWFRVVATMGVLLFNWYLLKYAVDRPGMICLLAAGMYLVSFLALVVMVREGAYPPPEARPTGAPVERAVKSVGRYMRECYSHSFYWKIYLFNVFFICGFVPFRMFLNIYATDTRHIDLGKLGHAYAIRDIIQMGVFLALGPIVDRIHPIRAGVAANVLTLATGLAAALFVGGGETGFLVWTVAVFASVAIFQASTSALGPRILPQKQYGQFCSANAMVFHVGLMAAMPAAGWVFDRIGYRYIYAWFAVFAVLSSASVILLYYDWKRLGGDENYVAPMVEEEPVEGARGFEVVTEGREGGVVGSERSPEGCG